MAPSDVDSRLDVASWLLCDVTLLRGDVALDRGDVALDRGDVALDRGDVTLHRGETTHISSTDHDIRLPILQVM